MADMLMDQYYDHYDDYYEYEYDYATGPKKLIKCKDCDKSPLVWGRVGNRWVLHEANGQVHTCSESLDGLKTIFTKMKKKPHEMDMKNKWTTVRHATKFLENEDRLTKDEYGCLIALSVASRSEDPHTQAGCCIVNYNGKILSTGYNGLVGGVDVPEILASEEYRDVKRVLFVHAETNALSLIKQGECDTIYLTMNPCANCAVNIAAHGMLNVVFIDDYPRSQEYKDIFKFYGVGFRKISDEEKENINTFIKNKMLIQNKTS